MRNANSLRVLVVDDDQGVLLHIHSVLIDAGFAVATAGSSREALNILEKDDFDVMVTDIALSDNESGIDLVNYARSVKPGIRSLFVSGISPPIVNDPDRDDFIMKPFRPFELVGCIYELVNRKNPKRQAAERASTRAWPSSRA